MGKLARDHRNRELALIHLGKKALAMTEEDYRQMIWTQGRVQSSTDLDYAGRQRVIAHLQALGFKPTGARGDGKRPVKRSLNAKQRLMWSLWQQLADLEEVRDRRMDALVAYAKRLTGVERLEWLKTHQENLVVDTLKKYVQRVQTARGLSAPAKVPTVPKNGSTGLRRAAGGLES